MNPSDERGGCCLEADHFPLGLTLALSHAGIITANGHVSESTLFVPQIAASEHCRDCSSLARTKCWRKLYQSVDGKTGPVPRTPRCTSGPSRKRVRRDPATRLRRVSSFFAAQTLPFQKLSCPPCGVNARAPRPARNAGDRVMSPTVTECLEHARQCEWYAARTNNEEDRKFLLWRADQWTKRAQEKELETRASPRRPAA